MIPVLDGETVFKCQCTPELPFGAGAACCGPLMQAPCGVTITCTSFVRSDISEICHAQLAGLQNSALLDSMHAFCLSLGLTISPSKTEVVFIGSSSDTWHVGQHVLPRSASFKYLGIVFHKSGGMTEALARLLQTGKGSAARLSAKHKALM